MPDITITYTTNDTLTAATVVDSLEFMAISHPDVTQGTITVTASPEQPEQPAEPTYPGMP